MIEPGYNGIEFGKYSEEYFLDHVSKRYYPLLKNFTHRDTQEDEEVWRVQGTISIKDFNNALEEMHGISNITDMKFAFPHRDRYLLTINIIKVGQLNK